MTTEDKLKAWEDFGASIQPLIPVLIGQLQGVVEETDRAAANLIERFQIISHKVLSENDTQTPQAAAELGKDFSQIVMHIQFQDITRQKIEHVVGPLEHMLSHCAALACDDQDEAAQQANLETLKSFSDSYTMASERMLMQEIQERQQPGLAETVGDASSSQEASITLF